MPKEAFVYQEAHFRVLRLLEGNPQMNQRDLAAAAGVSVSASEPPQAPQQAAAGAGGGKAAKVPTLTSEQLGSLRVQ